MRSKLPEGWHEEFSQRADFDRAYQALVGVKGFYAESLRGKIRSLQLRFEEAWDHFERASIQRRKTKDSIATLVQQFTLHIWCFENAVAEARLEPAEGSELPDLWVPELPERIVKDYPEVMLTLVLRQYAEGLLRLHVGEYIEAAKLFEKLIRNASKAPGAQLPLYYLGLGASRFNLGEEEEARRNLENAGLTSQAQEGTLGQARVSGALWGMYNFMEEKEEANDWKVFLEKLPCPEATKEAFLKRGEMIVTRSQEAGGLLML